MDNIPLTSCPATRSRRTTNQPSSSCCLSGRSGSSGWSEAAGSCCSNESTVRLSVDRSSSTSQTVSAPRVCNPV